MIRVNATVSARTGKVVMVEEEVLDPSPDGVPKAVSRYQFKAALIALEKMGEVTLAMSSASPMVQLAWAEAPEMRRADALVGFITSQCNYSDADLDEIFSTAWAIT
ncbi:hypothetical protein FIU89_11105 [Roseovarius sp. THAF27]|uniref:hypothetical protein n=1 Tax=Roseovarius sp. THAF27 TaxID=2587850 RepID=UPI001268003E|nr:hypothetical protein [Roseovarius sp. THAF27]QFT81157.1 hypothetical protein FIU89_11105 [Roseovarius sp. THAF27]